jgi:hypothetical protein
MNLDLRGDNARSQSPRTIYVAGFFDQRRRSFIAGRFDAEDYHRFEQLSLTARA